VKLFSIIFSAIRLAYTEKAKCLLGIFCIALAVLAANIICPKDVQPTDSAQFLASEQEKVVQQVIEEPVEEEVIVEVVEKPVEPLVIRAEHKKELAAKIEEDEERRAAEEKKKEAEQENKNEHEHKSRLVEKREQERKNGQHRGVRQAGVYLGAGHTADDDYIDGVIKSLKDSGGTTFVFDVKGPYVYFESNAPYAKELNLIRPLYALPDVIEKAKENNIYTIARFVAANDSVFGAINPDVRIRHPQTNIAVGSKWVNLGHPDTLRYNKEILWELAASGVDEINIDYIRYPTEYSLASVGLTTEEKSANVTKFVKMARDVIEESGRFTNLGVSTYAILGWNYDVNLKTLGQDFVQFAEYVDVISPMAYPSTFKAGAYYNPAEHPGSRMYYLVYRTLEGYKELLGPEHAHKLRPWIQGYYITNKNMADQMQAVYDAGSCGFTIWSAGNYYDIFYKMFPQMDIPKECT